MIGWTVLTIGLLHFNSPFSAAGYVDMVQRSFMKRETAAAADQSDVAARGKADNAIGNFPEFNTLSCKTSYK
jgi:hypothetical protein